MELTNQQISFYKENGFLLLENVFDSSEMEVLLSEMDDVIKEDCPRRILEKNGSVRSFFAPHFSNELFNKINCLDRLVVPSSQLVGGKVYVHQSKINVKAAMLGDWWEWHQGYPYWKNDDGMPRPDVLTAMIFMNDITEFNGPLLLIPGSHRDGEFDDHANDIEADPNDSEWYAKYLKSASFMTSLTANLKYKLEKKTIAEWAEKKGIYSAKGPAGSVLFFHGNVFHASSNNLSPWDRFTYLITYNHVQNKLADIPAPRPEFIAIRNFAPIEPVTEAISIVHNAIKDAVYSKEAQQ
jgi:ectoine hydroxylase